MNKMFKTLLKLNLSFLAAHGAIAQETPPPTGADEVATNPGTDVLPSPYFIDGLICEGVKGRNIHGNWFIDEEAVPAVQRAEDQRSCEILFGAFGVHKFTWITPGDLEELDLTIKRSGYFDASEISIKKSELKNHVHVVAKVKPKTHRLYEISNEFSFFKGKDGQPSSRTWDDFSIQSVSRDQQPRYLKSWGVEFTGTYASQSLPTYDSYVSPSGAPSGNAYRSANFAVADIFFDLNQLIAENIALREHAAFGGDSVPNVGNNVAAHMDLVFQSAQGQRLGSLYVGPSILLSDLRASDENNTAVTGYNGERDTEPGFVAGYLFGQENYNFMKYDVSGYFGVQGKSRLIQQNFIMQKQFSSLDDALVMFGFSYVDAKNAPIAKYWLLNGPDAKEIFDVYAGLGKNFRQAKRLDQLSLRVGAYETEFSHFGAGNESASNPYLALNYKFITDDWNVNVGAKFVYGRNF